MLAQTPELKDAFTNPLSGEKKLIDSVRVDGATNEGPSHEEVQFRWASHHLEEGKLASLLTSHSSGSSYLNRCSGQQEFQDFLWTQCIVFCG